MVLSRCKTSLSIEHEEPCLALWDGKKIFHQKYPRLQADESDMWVDALNKPRQGHGHVDLYIVKPEFHLSKANLL